MIERPSNLLRRDIGILKTFLGVLLVGFGQMKVFAQCVVWVLFACRLRCEQTEPRCVCTTKYIRL